jgi:alpha-tubulin suppressor-like RCC1 family protein
MYKFQENNSRELRRKPKNVWTASKQREELLRMDGAFYNEKYHMLDACGNMTFMPLVEPTNVPRSSPVQVSQVGEFYKQVSHFRDSSFGALIRYDDELFMWGNNNNGQLGQNETFLKKYLVKIPGSWKTVSTSQDGHTAAIDNVNNLWTWGLNNGGQLGHDDTAPRSSPVQIPGSWIAVSCSYSSTIAVNDRFELWAWGNNASGTLGQSDIIPRSSPVQIPGKWSTKIDHGTNHVLAQKFDGGLFSWGNNDNGKLGTGDLIYYSSPVAIFGGSFTSISAGERHSVVCLSGTDGSPGRVFLWGNNDQGQLLVNDFINRSKPVQMVLDYRDNGANTNVRRIYPTMAEEHTETMNYYSAVAGFHVTYLFDSNGGLHAAGYNNAGSVPTQDRTKAPVNLRFPINTTSNGFQSPVHISNGYRINKENPHTIMTRTPNSTTLMLKEEDFSDRWEKSPQYIQQP